MDMTSSKRSLWVGILLLAALLAAGVTASMSHFEKSAGTDVLASMFQQSPSTSIPPTRFVPLFVPPGYELAENKTGTQGSSDLRPTQEMLLRRGIAPQDSDAATIRVIVTLGSGTDVDAFLKRSAGVTKSAIRGKPAAVSTGSDSPRSATMIYWLESSTISVQVVGRGAPMSDVTKVAEGLRAQ